MVIVVRLKYSIPLIFCSTCPLFSAHLPALWPSSLCFVVAIRNVSLVFARKTLRSACCCLGRMSSSRCHTHTSGWPCPPSLEIAWALWLSSAILQLSMTCFICAARWFDGIYNTCKRALSYCTIWVGLLCRCVQMDLSWVFRKSLPLHCRTMASWHDYLSFECYIPCSRVFRHRMDLFNTPWNSCPLISLKVPAWFSFSHAAYSLPNYYRISCW